MTSEADRGKGVITSVVRQTITWADHKEGEWAMYQQFEAVLGSIDDAVWGVPLIVLILFGGILLSFRLKGIQIRQLPRALKYMVKNEEGGTGEVSSFGALCTALSATIGTGNIVGVATAVVAGGPGASGR